MKKFWDWELIGALIVALVPFSLGVLLLEAYGPSGSLLPESNLASGNNLNLDAGKVTYVAVTSVHFVVCAIILLRCWVLFRDESTAAGMANDVLRRSAGPILFVFAMLLLFFVLACHLDSTYCRLATHSLSDIYGIPNPDYHSSQA